MYTIGGYGGSIITIILILLRSFYAYVNLFCIGKKKKKKEYNKSIIISAITNFPALLYNLLFSTIEWRR